MYNYSKYVCKEGEVYIYTYDIKYDTSKCDGKGGLADCFFVKLCNYVFYVSGKPLSRFIKYVSWQWWLITGT